MNGGSSRAARLERMALSVGRVCEVRGCTRLRGGLSLYCYRHRDRKRLYGHPEGTRIKPHLYRPIRRQVEALIKRYPEHPGIKYGLDTLHAWLEGSSFGDRKLPGYVHVARLQRYEVRAADVLAECAALWSFVDQHGMPDDERLTWQLALAMLYLAPREQRRAPARYGDRLREFYREANPKEKQAIGNHLRLQLAPLFANIARALGQEQQQAKQERASMSAPFPSTPINDQQAGAMSNE